MLLYWKSKNFKKNFYLRILSSTIPYNELKLEEPNYSMIGSNHVLVTVDYTCIQYDKKGEEKREGGLFLI